MATSSLGRLTLDLAVRLSEFTDGMSRAERETQDRTQRMQESVTSFREHLASELGGTQLGSIVDSFNERFGSIEGSITKVSGALAGMAVGGAVIGLGALSKLAIETAKADTEMAIFAQRANTTVESFQVLSTAAAGLGFSQEQLSSVLADTQEKLGEFTATEGGGAADFFDALKNNTKMTDEQIRQLGKTLNGKDGVEAVQLIKNKMDELGATSQEQRFVFESLASDLTNLLPLFEDGGKLLGMYGDELRKAGVIKTKEAIEQSQILAAQTQSVQQRFSVFKTQLAGAMMPVLNSLLQHYMSGSEKGAAFGGVIQSVAVVAKGAAAIILTFTTAIGMFGNTMGMVLAQLSNLGDTYVAFENAEGVTAKAQALVQGFRNATTMGKDWWNQIVADGIKANNTMGAIVNGQNGQLDILTKANYTLATSQRHVNDGLKISTKQANDEADAKDKAAKSTLNHAKALEKLQARLVGISGNSGIGTGAHLDIRVSGGSRRLTASELARFQADGKPLAAYRKTSDYGYRGNIGVNGASKYHRGIDFAMPVGTPITTKVPVKNVSNFYDSKGGGYVQRIVFEDGLSVDLLHQSPASKGIKGGSSTTKSPYSSAKSESYSLIAKSNEDAKREAEQREKERQRNIQTIFERYATKDEVIEAKHKDNLALIDKTYAKNSIKWAKYTKEEKNRYYDEMYEYTSSIALKYATEEEKIDIEHYKKLREIKRDFANDPTERDRRVALQNESYKKDVANFKWAQGEKARAQQALIDKIKGDIGNSVMQSTNDYLDATMKSSLTPEQYSKWRLQQDYQRDASNVMAQYSARDAQINEVDKEGNFVLNDQQRYEAQLAARQEYLAKMYVMEADYATKVTDLDKQQAEARSQSIGNMFSTMTGAAATFFGQQSAMYRAAFAMEKAYAVYKAVMNIRETYSNTYNSVAAIPVIGPYIAAPTAAAAAAVQVAQAAQLRSMQAPSVGGIAHGGLDYVPKETTFLLDEGERVLSPRQNKDLTRYLNERQNTTGGNVNVYNNSSAQVTAERQPNGEVTIEVVDKMIKRSWGKVAQANSFESRQIQKHTTARFNRQ